MAENGYKTEEELKQEAAARRRAEARRPAPRKSETAKKAENYWYHYKWHTLAALAALVFASFFVRDIFFAPKPDATVVMVTSAPYPAEQTEQLAQALESAAPPSEKGRPAYILVDSLSFAMGQGDENASEGIFAPASEYDYAATIKLTAVIAAGSEHIFLLDEDAFDYLENVAGGESIFLPESVPASVLGLEGFSDGGLRFYIRRMDENAKNYAFSTRIMQNLRELEEK